MLLLKHQKDSSQIRYSMPNIITQTSTDWLPHYMLFWCQIFSLFFFFYSQYGFMWFAIDFLRHNCFLANTYSCLFSLIVEILYQWTFSCRCISAAVFFFSCSMWYRLNSNWWMLMLVTFTIKPYWASCNTSADEHGYSYHTWVAICICPWVVCDNACDQISLYDAV